MPVRHAAELTLTPCRHGLLLTPALYPPPLTYSLCATRQSSPSPDLYLGPNLSHSLPPTGDKWCLCATRWSEALEANVAPPLYLKATHQKVRPGQIRMWQAQATAFSCSIDCTYGMCMYAAKNTDVANPAKNARVLWAATRVAGGWAWVWSQRGPPA